jgi:hypothetical protein
MEEKNLKKESTKPASNEVSAETKEEQITGALKIAEEAIFSMAEYINDIVGDFRKNDLPEANAKLSELIEIVNLFIQLISQVKEQSPKFEKFKDVVPQIEGHLLETVKEILEVKQNDDDTSLCDLLEYELGDNLEKWHKKVIQPLLS